MCDGTGYLTIYKLLSTMNTTSTPNFKPTSIQSSIPSSTTLKPATLQTLPPSSSNIADQVKIGVGIALGAAGLGLFLIFCVWWMRKLLNSRAAAGSGSDEGHIGGNIPA